VTTMMWTLTWWWYHIVLVISTLIMLYGVIAQYRSHMSIIRTSNQENESSGRIRIGNSSSMQNLIAITEAKDKYTAGHNYRVAMYGLQIAQAMNLDPEQLRALARGGLIHDVGKLLVPGEILNKPGKLTADERAVIEQHP